MIGSRKIGGTARDGVNIRPKYATPKGAESIRRNYGDDSRSEVILDGAGNVYLASNTQSVAGLPAQNFPVTANAFQKTPGGGRQDGVVIKTSPDLTNILFASYLGCNFNDDAFI